MSCQNHTGNESKLDISSLKILSPFLVGVQMKLWGFREFLRRRDRGTSHSVVAWVFNCIYGI